MEPVETDVVVLVVAGLALALALVWRPFSGRRRSGDEALDAEALPREQEKHHRRHLPRRPRQHPRPPPLRSKPHHRVVPGSHTGRPGAVARPAHNRTVATLTPRQLEAVQAHVAAGSVKGAAHRLLGLAAGTVHNQLTVVRGRLGVEMTEQAVYLLTARGELEVPDLRREPRGPFRTDSRTDNGL